MATAEIQLLARQPGPTVPGTDHCPGSLLPSLDLGLPICKMKGFWAFWTWRAGLCPGAHSRAECCLCPPPSPELCFTGRDSGSDTQQLEWHLPRESRLQP